MLRIRNWEKHFETNESRKLKRLLWVKIPNQQDSLAFRLVAAHKRGSDIFTAWILMIQVASKSPKRGDLPESPDELGIITGFPAEIFKLAFEFLKTPKIQWIEQYPEALGDIPDLLGKYPDTPPVELGEVLQGREGNTHNQNGEGLKSVFEGARKEYPGVKRGLETEWENFQKKYKSELSEILPLLLPAINEAKTYRQDLEKMKVKFIPQWKNFSTWINNRCWEEVFPDEVQV